MVGFLLEVFESPPRLLAERRGCPQWSRWNRDLFLQQPPRDAVPVFGGAPRSPSPPCFEMDKVGSPKASAGRRPSFSLRPEPPRTMEVDGYVQEMWGHWRCRQVSPGSQAQGHHILTVRHGEVRENGAIVSDGVTPRITSDASPGFWALPPWVDVTAQPAAVRIN